MSPTPQDLAPSPQLVAPDSATEPATGLVVDARGEAAWERLLGLQRYQRALLAAQHAGLEELWLWIPAARRAEAEAFARDPRLGQLRLASEEAELPAYPRVEGGATFDAAAAKALALGADPREAGTFLPADAPRSAASLLRSLENECDGLVDTYLNRPISRLISRALVGTGISPNAVTLLAFAVALVGIALIATRRWELALAGALVFQFSAALDCVDGELARLTYRFSPLGARLDLALDNVAHVLLFLALGWAAVPALGQTLALTLGGVAALGALISFALVYRLTFARPAHARSPRVQGLLDRLANRDFSVLVVVACAAGRPELLLWLLACGTHVFWPILAWASREKPDSVAR